MKEIKAKERVTGSDHLRPGEKTSELSPEGWGKQLCEEVGEQV